MAAIDSVERIRSLGHEISRALEAGEVMKLVTAPTRSSGTCSYPTVDTNYL